MPDTGYLLAVLAIGFGITFALRAVPFLILKPLRGSRFVAAMVAWMPAGLLAILAAATFVGSASGAPGNPGKALVAVAVTVAVHLGLGRRTLLSVGLGTLAYVTLVNLA